MSIVLGTKDKKFAAMGNVPIPIGTSPIALQVVAPMLGYERVVEIAEILRPFGLARHNRATRHRAKSLKFNAFPISGK